MVLYFLKKSMPMVSLFKVFVGLYSGLFSQSTAMVMARRSVDLTTLLFLGKLIY